MEEVLEMAIASYGVNKGEYILCSLDSSVPVALVSTAGDWFGTRLWLCKIPNTPLA